MRLFSMFGAVLCIVPVTLLSAGELLRAPPAVGGPGSATPQPYSQPQVRPIGNSVRNPPLLNNPAKPRAMSIPQPLPKDRPLPQLEEQRQRNLQHPAETMDSLERAK